MTAWFKPKRYGYGPTPISWQGWLLTAVYFAVILVATWMFLPADRPATIDWPQWLVLVGGATVGDDLDQLPHHRRRMALALGQPRQRLRKEKSRDA